MVKSILFGVAIVILSALPVSAAKPDHAGGKPGGGGGSTPQSRLICVDPGHGGSDPGAQYAGVNESDLNLSVAVRVKELLSLKGFEAQLTRDSDVTLTNNDRYTFCNSIGAGSLVSIHHNASTDASIDYTMGMYHQGSSKSLAEVVSNSVAAALGNGIPTISRYPSGVLIKSDMPSMMSEAYFMSNLQRQSQLKNPDYRAALEATEANAIVEGLLRYYGQ